MKLTKILALNIMITFVICILIFPVYGADPTTEVHIIKYASDGTTILNEIRINYIEMAQSLPVIGDGITHYYHQGPVFDCPPGPWDDNETTNFKDKGALKGTDVKDLCEMVGGMSPGDEIKISAVDGLNRWFNYNNVYEPQSRQGSMVICWENQGNYVPDYEEGMQLVFFADNSTNPENKNVFGNQDMHECLAPEYRYNFSEVYPSSDGLSVKWIGEIAIYSNETAPTTWNLELTGAVNETISQTTFEDSLSCYYVSYTDSRNRKWTGIPLWYLMGRVDDNNIDGCGALDFTLANEGYNVTVTAIDGYSQTFNSTYVTSNKSYFIRYPNVPIRIYPDDLVRDKYIVACYLNDSVLPELSDNGKALAPLKLVGPFLSSGQEVGNIASISLDISPVSQNEWDLTLDGAVTDIVDRSTFESCSGCHGVSWTDESNREWSGMPLWLLAGTVDDINTHGSGAFNDTLADEGYDVSVIACDNYSKTFNSTYLAHNDSYIVACYLNGSALPELTDDGKALAPLKLVGPFLSGGQKVSNIARISLDISPVSQEVDLTLIGNETVVCTLEQIKAMPSYTAGGGFKKSTGVMVGPYNYTGINVTDLTDIVGGITPSNSVKVTASDGYSMTYSYDQVMGNITKYNITTGDPKPDGIVTMVLAFEEEGETVSEQNGGPLRIAFTGPDSSITDGHFWVKQITTIEVLGAVDEWNLTLDGSFTNIVDRSTFESCSGCHCVSWTDDKDREWSGIPIWLLIGVIDDNVSSEAKHYFNDSIANEGYNVTVIADDGYNKTFNSSFVKRNNNIILANEINGTVLPEDFYPLRLTGSDLKKSEMVGNVVEMQIPELMPD